LNEKGREEDEVEEFGNGIGEKQQWWRCYGVSITIT
jgi:hypothetical protein